MVVSYLFFAELIESRNEILTVRWCNEEFISDWLKEWFH